LFPDDEILTLATLEIEPEKLGLFNQLLTAQKEKGLSAEDAADLGALGSYYDRVNLVKSYTMVEAVRRNLISLREPT